MDIKQEAITEYLTKGTGYRQLAKKYGVSRSTINKWVMIHQGIYNLAPTQKQQRYYLSAMNSKATRRYWSSGLHFWKSSWPGKNFGPKPSTR